MRLLTLLIVFIFLFSYCGDKEEQVLKGELLKVKEISYPSGSTISFHKGKLYLMGDDAQRLLILDTSFNSLDSLLVFPERDRRTPKAVKPDIESSEMIDDSLWLLGSGTLTPYRDSIFRLSFLNGSIKRSSLKVVYDKAGSKIENLNIEGFTKIEDLLVFGNRRIDPEHRNFFITTASNSLENQNKAGIKIIPFAAPSPDAGISGLSFYPQKDILFVTCSEEFTGNSYQDGAIGQSYLGIIKEASEKLEADSISTLSWIPLSAVSESFNNIKIESVAVSEIKKDVFLLYLTADNDNGKTVLFKVRLIIK